MTKNLSIEMTTIVRHDFPLNDFVKSKSERSVFRKAFFLFLWQWTGKNSVNRQVPSNIFLARNTIIMIAVRMSDQSKLKTLLHKLFNLLMTSLVFF